MIEELLWEMVDRRYDSMVDLSRDTKQKPSTLAAWRRGQHRIPLRDAEIIARAVGLEVTLTVRRPQ